MNEPLDVIGTPPQEGAFSYDIFQGYPDTCGIRSQQLILREFGQNLLQEDLIKEAQTKGWYSEGTPVSAIGNLLESHGVGVSRYEHAGVDDLIRALAQGKKVIVGVDADELWGETPLDASLADQTPNHALIVAGIDMRHPDGPMVVLTDPGTGDVAKQYPLDVFRAAWNDSGRLMVVTNTPVPGLDGFDYDAGHILAPVEGLSYEEWDASHAEAFSNPSCIGLDCDGNGSIETWAHDVDADGTIDFVTQDVDGDGIADFCQQPGDSFWE